MRRRCPAFAGIAEYQTHPEEPVGLAARIVAVAIAFAAIAEMGQAQTFHPDIPKGGTTRKSRISRCRSRSGTARPNT